MFFRNLEAKSHLGQLGVVFSRGIMTFRQALKPTQLPVQEVLGTHYPG
jgi:hypothetical protein